VEQSKSNTAQSQQQSETRRRWPTGLNLQPAGPCPTNSWVVRIRLCPSFLSYSSQSYRASYSRKVPWSSRMLLASDPSNASTLGQGQVLMYEVASLHHLSLLSYTHSPPRPLPFPLPHTPVLAQSSPSIPHIGPLLHKPVSLKPSSSLVTTCSTYICYFSRLNMPCPTPSVLATLRFPRVLYMPCARFNLNFCIVEL